MYPQVQNRSPCATCTVSDWQDGIVEFVLDDLAHMSKIIMNVFLHV